MFWGHFQHGNPAMPFISVVIFFQLEVPLDLNSNLSSIMHSTSISVAKPYILHADKVTIFSWDALNPRHSRKMDISIQTSQICHEIINGPLSRNFIKGRQMCGIPFMDDQRITAVI